MKIIIVSRTIFPLLTPRAFRTTELAKEFARMGHAVTIYAVLGNYDYSQFQQETGIIVKPIKMRFSTLNSDGKIRYNFFDKIGFHLLHKVIEYPDIEFVWKLPSILKDERNVDLLITIAFPHPIHWGSAWFKSHHPELFPKLWVSDCGDPYTGNSVSKKIPFWLKKFEKFWCKYTDYISVPLKDAKLAYPYALNKQLVVIPQGFDFSQTPILPYKKNSIPTFIYAGNIYKNYRDPSSLLDYLSTLSMDFKFIIFTKEPKFYITHKEKLGEKLDVRPFVQRDKLIQILSTCDFLINLKNPRAVQAPSKLIDYKLSGRPIINISTPFSEIESLNRALSGNPIDEYPNFDLNQFDIKNVAEKFIALAK